MANLIVSEFKTQYLIYYKDLTKEMMKNDSIYQQMFNKMLEEFDGWGLAPEEKARITAQTVMTILPQFEQMAQESARQLILLEHEIPVKDGQTVELERKTQYYDDRLLETILEKQADLASFAVNANSDSAQTTINDLKEKMHNVEKRVVPVNGNDCPAPTPVIATPSGLNVVSTSDTTLTISWLPVEGATTYALYRDGVQIASSGALTMTDTGLVQLTKYSYNVRAIAGSLSSDLSSTVVGSTLATIP